MTFPSRQPKKFTIYIILPHQSVEKLHGEKCHCYSIFHEILGMFWNPKLQNETKQAKIMPRSFSRHIRLVAIIVYSWSTSRVILVISRLPLPNKKKIILAWVVYCVFFYFPCLWQSSSYRKKKYWLYSNTLKESANLRTKEFGIEILSQNSAISVPRLRLCFKVFEHLISWLF